MIRGGMRPGIVVSLELNARTRRSVGVGGEHNLWWIKLTWSMVVEVAATLAAMALRGNALVGRIAGELLGYRGIIHNPVHMHLLLHRIVQP
jgi:hypothetical protein